ncbi:unnamed protein product [Meloidogyne enterolobii]|uniref:Uncharacterized protein n=1 Tax=Meloidogyne enterolobii TaxID=390850 RepID=A0ACB1APY8_MELEN
MTAYFYLQMHFNLISFFLLIFLVIVESIPDHYKTLGVPKNASTKEIRTAYKKLMLKYHPDKTKNDPIALRFSQEINNARDILTDEKERRDYDKKLHESFGSSHTTPEGASTSGKSERTSGSSATPRESSRASDGASTKHGGAPTSGKSSASHGEASSSYGGASATHGGASSSYQGAYRSSDETSSDSSDESQEGTSSIGRSWPFTFGSWLLSKFWRKEGSSTGSSTSNSAKNDFKIFVFSDKILVQINDEVKQADNLKINGNINKLLMFGDYIKHYTFDRAEIIKAKSVEIEVNGAYVYVDQKKISYYTFHEEFKKLKPTGYITDINGGTNKIIVR